jgi:hypothetical protein
MQQARSKVKPLPFLMHTPHGPSVEWGGIAHHTVSLDGNPESPS